jgi:hypothetical protein
MQRIDLDLHTFNSPLRLVYDIKHTLSVWQRKASDPTPWTIISINLDIEPGHWKWDIAR